MFVSTLSNVHCRWIRLPTYLHIIYVLRLWLCSLSALCARVSSLYIYTFESFFLFVSLSATLRLTHICTPFLLPSLFGICIHRVIHTKS